MHRRGHAGGVRAAALALLVTGVGVGCASPGRDVVPEVREVRGTTSAGPEATATAPKDGYVYVAQRPHCAVGLVGSRVLADDDARARVDRIADTLEACARRLEAGGTLVSGAVQLVAISGAHGTTDIADIRFAPGGAIAANALECIVAPLRAAPFPSAGDAGVPALAIEATWDARRGAAVDAGGSL